jgi:hypothetical protein
MKAVSLKRSGLSVSEKRRAKDIADSLTAEQTNHEGWKSNPRRGNAQKRSKKNLRITEGFRRDGYYS